MNAARRKTLGKLQEKLEELKYELESVLEEEEEARDNIPESLWETERYERAEEACDSLGSALDSLEEVLDYITGAVEC